jgi:hypothetical protein
LVDKKDAAEVGEISEAVAAAKRLQVVVTVVVAPAIDDDDVIGLKTDDGDGPVPASGERAIPDRKADEVAAVLASARSDAVKDEDDDDDENEDGVGEANDDVVD